MQTRPNSAEIDKIIELLKALPKRKRNDQSKVADVIRDRALEIYVQTRNKRLKEALVQHFSWMVGVIIRRYPWSADLEQVAYLALVKSLNGYDPTLGSAFASYAFTTIYGEVKRYFRDHSWGVEIGRANKEILERMRRILEENARLSLREIADKLEIPLERLEEALVAEQAANTISLFASVNQSGGTFTLADVLPAPESGLAAVENRETVRRLMSLLDERAQRILYMRFYLHMTQEKIAAEFGVSQMHVSRLITKALTFLRENYER